MDIESIKSWANGNQGFLAIILFFSSVFIGWVTGFFKWLFVKFDKHTPYINAGGDISVGNKTFVQKSGKQSTNVQGENITLNKYFNDK